jgi:hypothetical protein
MNKTNVKKKDKSCVLIRGVCCGEIPRGLTTTGIESSAVGSHWEKCCYFSQWSVNEKRVENLRGRALK